MGRGGGLRCRSPHTAFTCPSQLHLLPDGHEDTHRHVHTSRQVHQTRRKHSPDAQVSFIWAILVLLPLKGTTSGRSPFCGLNYSLDQFPYLSSTCHHLQDASRTQPLLTTSLLPAWPRLPSALTWITTTESLLISLLPSFASYHLFTHQPEGSF